MKFIKQTLSKTLNWSKNHFWLTVAIFVSAFWLMGQSSNHSGVYSTRVANYSYDESVDMAYDTRAVAESAPMAFQKSSGSIGIIPPVYADDIAPDSEQKLIKNASVTLTVEKTEEAKLQAEAITKEANGLISNINSWEVRSGVLQYNMTLRIPAESLDETTKKIEALGIKTAESVNVTDITARYQDNQARVKNLEVQRERLREISQRETDNINDLIQVEKELNRVQSELDNLERSLRQDDNAVAYSTLNLSLNPEPQIGDINNPDWSVERTWKTAVNDLLQSLQGILGKAIRLLVFTPIWLPILIVLWFIKRRFFK